MNNELDEITAAFIAPWGIRGYICGRCFDHFSDGVGYGDTVDTIKHAKGCKSPIALTALKKLREEIEELKKQNIGA